LDRELKHSTAFTLLELIVVVFIISLVGFMVFSTAVKHEQKVEILDISKLPNSFRKAFKGEGDVELFCIKKCRECYVSQGKNIVAYEGEIELGTDVKSYLLDSDNHLIEMDELGRVKDEKICLRYHLYPNGSTTQMIISSSQGIFYLPSYFGKAQKVEDLEEAKELWIQSKYDLKDSGSYY